MSKMLIHYCTAPTDKGGFVRAAIYVDNGTIIPMFDTTTMGVVEDNKNIIVAALELLATVLGFDISATKCEPEL